MIISICVFLPNFLSTLSVDLGSLLAHRCLIIFAIFMRVMASRGCILLNFGCSVNSTTVNKAFQCD